MHIMHTKGDAFSLMVPTTGIETCDLRVTSALLYQLSYVGDVIIIRNINTEFKSY